MVANICKLQLTYQLRSLAQAKMSAVVRSALGILGGILLLHAGYSAYESLSYEKSLDPSSQLEIPLDVDIHETLFAADLFCRYVWKQYYQ